MNKNQSYLERVKQTPPHRIDKCGNPKCKNKIKRWTQINATMRKKYCSVSCGLVVRDRTKKPVQKISFRESARSFHDHRTTHCKRETHVKGNMENCAHYSECNCLDFGEWRDKALTGCYVSPNNVISSGAAMGGSFAQASVAGNWFK